MIQTYVKSSDAKKTVADRLTQPPAAPQGPQTAQGSVVINLNFGGILTQLTRQEIPKTVKLGIISLFFFVPKLFTPFVKPARLTPGVCEFGSTMKADPYTKRIPLSIPLLFYTIIW